MTSNSSGSSKVNANQHYNALEAHTNKEFAAGLPKTEVDYYSKIHSVPSKIEVKVDMNAKKEIVLKKQSGDIATSHPSTKPPPSTTDDVSTDKPRTRRRPTKKNNFRDKEIEAWAKSLENEKIK